MPRPSTKKQLSDEAMVEAAIAARANADETSTVSAGFSSNPSANPSAMPSATQSPRAAAEVIVSVAGTAGAGEPTSKVPYRSALANPSTGLNHRRCGWLGFAFFSLLSLADMTLRITLAGRVAAFYGGERAESFWWLLVMQCVAALVGIVFLVSRVAVQQTVAGKALQERLEKKREGTVLLLMACMVQPEMLRCVLPGAEFLFTIVKIDTLASALAGLPFLGLATSFAVEEKFGDRYGVLRAIARFANTAANGTLVEDIDCHSPGVPALAASSPPAVPPPPFPPADPSGDTTVLAVWTASFVLFVVLVKLVRLTISWQARAQTDHLRAQLASLTAELEAERQMRAEEYQELMSLREHYYGAPKYAGHLESSC